MLKFFCVQALGEVLIMSIMPSQWATFAAICLPFLFPSNVLFLMARLSLFHSIGFCVCWHPAILRETPRLT